MTEQTWPCPECGGPHTVVDVLADDPGYGHSVACSRRHKYLLFRVDLEPHADRKTPIVGVYSKDNGIRLGHIKWWGRWRQFCFFPAAMTLFNPDCMKAIANHCASLTKAHRGG